MNELSLFAGVGGGLLAGAMLGWRTVCAVERDAHCASILAQRQNDGCLNPFPIWSDVCSFDGRPWRGIVDVVSGGFPCQDISPAGKGAGIEGERSGLWKEFARIICEVQPAFAWVENSSALSTRGLGVVLANLAEMGFDAEWGVLGAKSLGFPHERSRMWILASHPERSERGSEPHDGTSGRVGRKQQPFSWDRHWLDLLPRVRGNDYGMAYRLDRTDAIRNGQVPRVAARAFRELSERLTKGETA
jgi:DNA (cytosine-5)-methyltransferase 1